MNNKFKYIIGLLFIITVFYNNKFKDLNFVDFFLKEYNIKYLLFLFFFIFSIFFSSLRFLLILKKQKIYISLINSFKLSLNQFAFNTILFSGVGEVIKYLQNKSIKVNSDKMILSIAMERFFGFVASIFLIIMSFFFLIYFTKNIMLMLIYLLIFIIIFLYKNKIYKTIWYIPYVGYFNFTINQFFKKKKFINYFFSEYFNSIYVNIYVLFNF